MTMRSKVWRGAIFALLAAVSAAAHDLFLKFDDYFLPPQTQVEVRLLNGYFNKSEGVVTRDRMNDVSLVAPSGAVTHPAVTDWRDEGQMSLLRLTTGDAGTYVVGLSTKPREITLKAKDFNAYLREDGLPDTLAERRRAGELGKDARERYSKHVKAIFQVSEARTATFSHALGYPVEIIPQQNPYDLQPGRTLEVLCLKDGQPLAGQFVMAGREAGKRVQPVPGVRTDERGVARIPLSGPGRWYVKFINMRPSADPQLNYESLWATLTFAVRARTKGK
jgi:uncharacterized GH25 family protein